VGKNKLIDMFEEDKVRDPGRIERILETLQKAWEAQPDLRLGQLLVNCLERDYLRQRDFRHELFVNHMFFIEDDRIKEVIGGCSEG
jgi:uncharacterized protein YihD (DUF1040 family)